MALKSPDLQSLKNVDWRKVASYANPQSVKDLDAFLDKLPQRAGMTGIIVASIIWGIAGAAILLAYTKSVDLQKLREEMTQAEALRPTVPQIAYTDIPEMAIKAQVDRLKLIHRNLTIEGSAREVKIAANSTRDFSAWRAAIGDLGFGAAGWRVQVKTLCAGRECEESGRVGGVALQAILSVQQLDINLPEAKEKKS